jgi:hypothetical protein
MRDRLARSVNQHAAAFGLFYLCFAGALLAFGVMRAVWYAASQYHHLVR